MMPQRHARVKLPYAGVIVYMTTHRGGQAIRRVIDAGILTAHNYLRKHIFIGEWKLSFPGGSPDVFLSGVNVWPQETINCPNGFVWEALEDAMYYCVLPFSDRAVNVNALDLEAGELLVLPRGCLMFVPPGATLELNGETRSGPLMIATERAVARIKAVTTMQVQLCSGSHF